ncbi:MAG: hypothetical protein UT32_C0009G0006 [Parcubacteria group bacterium GW2011_GWC2_39_14]|nr:MAG: hypothetical protein UT32_C0009G0006 [Parcubacteria group bacterium GW2011_GWC2_39_14]KKR55345.1 MAG: hypothetical protein UT91_C0002G0006 [Parcubacteria group bacterium GW2011_GWA2_40_23]
MQHSSRQTQRELEYARQNKEYVEEKRDRLAEFKRPSDEADLKKKEKHSSGYYCCISIFVLVALSCGLIWYFVVNIKDSVYKEWINKREQVQNALPQGKEEIKKSLEQGETLLNQTQNTAADLKTKYEKAEDLYQKGVNTVDQLEGAKEKVENVLK